MKKILITGAIAIVAALASAPVTFADDYYGVYTPYVSTGTVIGGNVYAPRSHNAPNNNDVIWRSENQPQYEKILTSQGALKTSSISSKEGDLVDISRLGHTYTEDQLGHAYTIDQLGTPATVDFVTE